MKKITQRLFLIAALLLVLLYFLPLWVISLEAPQYPEGIGLYIWVNQITGKNPHDLKNINGLNHYIGMKEINPESIPELKIMPFIIGFLIVFGLAAALLKKVTLLYTWLILLAAICIIGLVDFYLWEYDYGHNLNPMAAIKIPGMSYQPPLIGSKQLLNMRTTSLPASGGIIIMVSFLTGASAIFINHKKKVTDDKILKRKRREH